MASQEHQEEPESFEPQELVVEQSETIIDNSKAILEVSNTEITAEDNKFSPSLENPRKTWRNLVLDKIGSFLPKYMPNSLSNWTLIKIVSVSIVLILSISVIVLPSRAESDIPSESAEKISIPPQEIEVTLESIPTEEIETTATEKISIPPQEIEVTLESTPTEEIETTATETPSQSKEVVSTPVEIETPETLVAPQKPENLTIKTTPPPEPILTPEQIFFSTVQTKVSEITSQYGEDLIVSGEADLLSSHLLIKVNDDWYQLSKSRQDKFVNETFKRSQKFNFSQLEIQDLQNNLVARSPVVGNQMIILQRTNSN